MKKGQMMTTTTFDELVDSVAAICFEDALDKNEMFNADDAANGVEPLARGDQVAFVTDVANETLMQEFVENVRKRMAELAEDHFR